jgi:excinuclease ABC subunit A
VRLIEQLRRLVDAGNTVVVVEHDMSLVAAADWVIDIGPGSGDEGGKLVAAGPPAKLAAAKGSRTAGYLAKVLSAAFA